MKNNVILLFICLLLTGCMTSKYAQKMQSLQIGMTPNQVIAIMGSPQSTSAKDNSLYYVYSATCYNGLFLYTKDNYVKFVDGHVVSFGEVDDFDSIKDNKIKVSVDNKTTTKTITSNQEDAWNKLQQLKKMLDSDLITEEEFQNKKKEIIDSL